MKNQQAVSGRLARLAAVGGVLLLAAGLRLYRLAGQSLWSDEGNSVALARRGFIEIAHRTAFDIHPPFYYWLLKLWMALFGDSEAALRSLSALLGIGLVYLVWEVGYRLFGRRVGLIAALLAAVSPLLIYYAQEARMYSLLAFLTTLTVLLALLVLARSRLSMALAAAYVLTVAAGLYTHYAYPVILLVVNLIAGLHYLGGPQPAIVRLQVAGDRRSVGIWLGLQLIPLLLYLPWLPTAWRQLTTWPSDRGPYTLLEIGQTIATTLLLGLSWPYGGERLAMLLLSVVVIVVPLPLMRLSSPGPLWERAGMRTSESTPALFLIYLWLLLPVLLTALIFSPAFLKFLVVAVPPLCLLLALLIDQLARSFRPAWFGFGLGGAILLALVAVSLLSVGHYFTNPVFARDNYRGLAQFIQAVGSSQDAVILNAEGQQDVFDYYYQPGPDGAAPVYPLPRRRPLDEANTVAELEAITARTGTIYAVYWAARQADPAGLIEGWLDSHLYKASDQWYGNVRLVSYASPRGRLAGQIQPLDIRLGEQIRLTGYRLAADTLVPGDILQVELRWQAAAPIAEDYVVFLQVLDGANRLVGQRDAQPRPPVSAWEPGEIVLDHHGLFIEPGTPPGPHRLIVGLYNPATGQRLPVAAAGDETAGSRDFVELAAIEVTKPAVPLPEAAFRIQTPLVMELTPGLKLLGYDLYKLGHRSSPETPLYPGDPVRLVVYWQRTPADFNGAELLTVMVESATGADTPVSLTSPLAGVTYPPADWTAGEIVRAQYDLFLSGLEPGRYRLRLVVAGSAGNPDGEATTRSFRIVE